MIITQIEKRNKRYKIYVDDQFVFALYWQELEKFDVSIGAEIVQDDIEMINRMLQKRGLQYGYHLLARRNYTHKEIVDRLVRADYKRELANLIAQLIVEKGYIDDMAFAKRYIEGMKDKKSLQQIRIHLGLKGVSRECIDDLIAETPIDEYLIAKQLFDKKLKGNLNPTTKELQAVYRFLSYKGFSRDILFKLFDKLDN